MRSSTNEPWWQTLRVSEFDDDRTAWFCRSVFADACGSKTPIFSFHTEVHANVNPTGNFLESVGMWLIEDSERLRGASETRQTKVYVRKDAVLVLASHESGAFEIDLATFDSELRESLKVFLSNHGSVKPPPCRVFAIVRKTEAHALCELGQFSEPLERQNYAEEVLEQYDHVAHELRSRTPDGRLVLISGEPGTGKSYLLRGLIAETEALFVYVPSSLAGALSAPDILPLILEQRKKAVPIVLLLEDAGSSLFPRSTVDNFDRVSELLSFGDGILGELADLRVIATIGSANVELDNALLRPGRLCAAIDLKKLSSEHARRVFFRLTGKDLQSSGPRTLAEVYYAARGGRLSITERVRAGFLSDDDRPL